MTSGPAREGFSTEDPGLVGASDLQNDIAWQDVAGIFLPVPVTESKFDWWWRLRSAFSPIEVSSLVGNEAMTNAASPIVVGPCRSFAAGIPDQYARSQ